MMQSLFKILLLFLLTEIVTAQDTIPAIPSDLYVKDEVSRFPIFMDGDFDINDYDNDGDQDIIILGSRQSSWTEYHPEGTLKRVELNKNSAGVFSKEPLEVIGVHNLSDRMHPECIKWVDFNNDGLADLIYSGEDSLYTPITYVYENSSSGFILRNDIIFNVGRASIYPYDFNSDGYPELIMHNQRDAQTSSIYFFKNSNGKFIQDTVFAVPCGILKLVDLNQDGNMDFISVRQDTLIYFENKNSEFHRSDYSIRIAVLELRFNIECIDLDRDGDLDLQAGNTTLYNNGTHFTEKRIPLGRSLLNGFVKFYPGKEKSELFLLGTYFSMEWLFSSFIKLYEIMDDSVSETGNIFFNNELFLSSVKWSDLNDDGADDMIIMCRFGFWIYYGTSRVTNVVNNTYSELTFSLIQNYPNPFNPSTTITFSIPETRFVSLKVFDILGREVVTLLQEQKPAGTYNITFNAANLASGTYVYQLNSGEYSSSCKMILVK